MKEQTKLHPCMHCLDKCYCVIAWSKLVQVHNIHSQSNQKQNISSQGARACKECSTLPSCQYEGNKAYQGGCPLTPMPSGNNLSRYTAKSMYTTHCRHSNIFTAHCSTCLPNHWHWCTPTYSSVMWKITQYHSGFAQTSLSYDWQWPTSCLLAGL